MTEIVEAAVRASLDGAAASIVGLGVDLVDLDRFRRVLDRTPTFVERVFTDDERAYADARSDPTERYAGRFAAKEATLKSLGAGLWDLPMRDIEVVRASSGEPSIQLWGKGPALAANRGASRLVLTITHTDDVALAVVVAVADSGIR